MSKLIQYAKECFENSKAHGFWDEGDNRSKGEMVMLMVSELSECLESHRSNSWYDFATRHNISGDACLYPVWDFKTVDSSPEAWENWFKEEIKDTVQDEIADVVIRVGDYVYGWQLPLIEREYRKESMGNFGHDLLRINWYILLAFEEKTELHPGKDWGYVLAAIEKFCSWYNIDIHFHIQQKMRYNSSRPYKHNKAY